MAPHKFPSEPRHCFVVKQMSLRCSEKNDDQVDDGLPFGGHSVRFPGNGQCRDFKYHGTCQRHRTGGCAECRDRAAGRCSNAVWPGRQGCGEYAVSSIPLPRRTPTALRSQPAANQLPGSAKASSRGRATTTISLTEYSWPTGFKRCMPCMPRPWELADESD